jgi:signal transduction histidine kinase
MRTRRTTIPWSTESVGCRPVSGDADRLQQVFWELLSNAMLYTIALILLVLWLLGFVSGYTIGAFIHVLLVIALVLLLVGVVSGRRVV